MICWWLLVLLWEGVVGWFCDGLTGCGCGLCGCVWFAAPYWLLYYCLCFAGVGWFCLVVLDLLVVCFLWWVSCGLILVV